MYQCTNLISYLSAKSLIFYSTKDLARLKGLPLFYLKSIVICLFYILSGHSIIKSVKSKKKTHQIIGELT